MQLKPLTTTTIGSFPRPAWLAATDRSRATFRLEGEALREAQDEQRSRRCASRKRSGSTSSPTASSGSRGGQGAPEGIVARLWRVTLPPRISSGLLAVAHGVRKGLEAFHNPPR